MALYTRNIKVYIRQFRELYDKVTSNIWELARVYGEYVEDACDDDSKETYEKCRGEFMRQAGITGVTEQFLDDLLQVRRKKLIPGIILYGHGLLRLRRMSMEDQQRIVEEGVECVRDDKFVLKKRLVEMASDDVVRVVAPLGTIRTTAQQTALVENKMRLHQHKQDIANADVGYAVLFHGVKFSTGRVFTIGTLRRIIGEWEETWGSKRRRDD